MINLKKCCISKFVIVALIFLLLHGHSVYGTAAHPQKNFGAAQEDYKQGFYEAAAAKLESILGLKEAGDHSFEAKVYMLLGACYEKSGKKEKAKERFVKLKEMVNEGLIKAVPLIPAVEPDSLPTYREVFGESAMITLNKPKEVSEIIKQKIVHAPRKSVEQKKKERRKKKFPWLIAVGAVLIIGTAAVLLFRLKKKDDEKRVPVIEWVQIPAGEFSMGDNFNEGAADEQPVHQVYLDEYYISKFEIIRDEFSAYCEDSGCQYPTEYVNHDLPATGVSWDEARAFCDWLSRETGENIHLPTEAQWEKAARGTDQRRYPWGNEPPDPNKARYLMGSATALGQVSIYDRNEGVSPYGVFDMAGNAAEWCADRYGSSYYSVSPVNNPTGPASGSTRVVRGGGCTDDAAGIRSCKRDSRVPTIKAQQIGFRIVKEVK